MGFKEDADFARYVTMGAVGTAAIARELRTRYDHRPIELERYAMANKVWAVKMKRMRIPDLVCTKCGRRVESKGKSKLEVKLSDSATEGREWSAGGMRDDDVFAFVRVAGNVTPEATGTPAYFTRGALAAAIAHVKRGGRKAASEGSEADLAWPVWVPKVDGTLVGLENDEVIYTTADDKRRKYWQSRNWAERHLYLAAGDEFIAESTIVAGVVEPITDLQCPGETWDIGADLRAADPTDRYAAVKAAGAASATNLIDEVKAIAKHDEDWRIRLEAMASLARLDDPAAWIEPIKEIARDIERDEAEQIEAIFILSEIPSRTAADALAAVAAPDLGRHEEVRAAAVWCLGTGACADPERLLEFTTDSDDRVALHAAAAMQALSPEIVQTLRSWLRDGDPRHAAIAAALLAHHGHIDALVAAVGDGETPRLWALRALGDLPPEEVEKVAGDTLTAEIREALAPLWIQHEDWLRTPENDPALPLLTEQKVRFEPTNP